MQPEEFIARLTQLRIKHGVSARDMSLSLGQNSSYINNIETGKSKPSLEGFFFICEYLGVTPSEFFDTENKNPSKLDDIIKNMRKLNDTQLDAIASLIKDLISR